MLADGGVVVCARAISDSSRHGGCGQRNGGGEDAEMRMVVGGPGSERKWMHGREGHATNTRGPGGWHNDDGASLSAVRCEKRPCMCSLPGLRREPVDLSVQTGETAAVYMHRRDGSTARGQTRQSSLRVLFIPRHSTTSRATPGDPSLLQCYRSQEARGWRAFYARHLGNGTQLTIQRSAYLRRLAILGPVEVGGDCA